MTTEGKIQLAVHDFVSTIVILAREAALETLTAHLAPDAPEPAAPAPRRAPAHTTPSRLAKATSRRPPKPGAKRPAADIARLEGVLTKHATKHPGQRVEQINKVLGTKTTTSACPSPSSSRPAH